MNHASAPPRRVELRLLGPLEVDVDGSPVAIGGLKQRAVLATLGLHAGRVVPADEVVAVVWGDAATERTAHTLQQHVSALRKLLEAPRAVSDAPRVLRTQSPGYRLDVGAVDVTEFEAAASECARATTDGRWTDAEQHATAATALWRGPALVDFRGSAWFDATATRLEELRIGVVEARADARLALGRPHAVVADLEAAVAEHPYRERVRALLALALYRDGRQADALAAIERARSVLAEELGLEPGPELQRLERAILDQDPALDARPASAEGLRATYRPGAGPGAAVQLPDGQIVSVADGPSIVGRDPAAAVRLLDSRVSRRHARIDPGTEGHVLVDLGSTNGTTVNGEPVAQRALHDGDRIGVGGVELVFHARWS